VTWAVDEFQWPRYTAADLAVVNRVLNEEDVPPLSYLHELLLGAKLIRHVKHHVLLTKTWDAAAHPAIRWTNVAVARGNSSKSIS
jgi:hypothetical protein